MAQTPPTTIDDYINAFSPEVQSILQNIRAIIREAAPEAEETISYAIPTFRLNGKNLVHFAAYTRHIGFYPTPSGIEQFKDQISAYKWAKGSVQFPLDQPIPYDLIRQITVFRVAESLEKAGNKGKRKG